MATARANRCYADVIRRAKRDIFDTFLRRFRVARSTRIVIRFGRCGNWVPGWVASYKQLRRCLAKAPNLLNERRPFHLVGNRVKISCPRVRCVVKNILSLDRCRTALLASEYQIDPPRKVLRDVLRFERGSVEPDELIGVALRPCRELHMADALSALQRAHRERVPVS